MKVLGLLGKIGYCLAVCAVLARADSIQLRDGRHLQGKYLGGTTTAIGFMTGATIEYFATTDVLVLIFDNGNDSPLSGLQPNPMKGPSPARPSGTARVRRISASTQDRTRQPTEEGGGCFELRKSTQMRSWRSKVTEREPDPGRR
jgi:hypothetical protein